MNHILSCPYCRGRATVMSFNSLHYVCESCMGDFRVTPGIKSLLSSNTQNLKSPEVLIGFCGKAGSGKDAAAEILVRRLFFRRIAFADSLKRIAKDVFGWDGQKDERGRKLLQRLGTEVGRDYDPDFWVRKLAESIPAGCEKVVIPDVRFPNEADWIARNHGVLFRIVGRGGLSGTAAVHASETALDQLDLPTIDNSDTLDALERTCVTLVPAVSTPTKPSNERRFRRV